MFSVKRVRENERSSPHFQLENAEDSLPFIHMNLEILVERDSKEIESNL